MPLPEAGSALVLDLLLHEVGQVDGGADAQVIDVFEIGRGNG